MPTLTPPRPTEEVDLRTPAAATEQRPPGVVTPQQHPLWLSALLHVLPGALLAVFIVAVTPLIRSWGLDPLFALLFGIGLVSAPFQLGYLALQAKRATGSWSPLGAVDYREPIPLRRAIALAAVPALFMVVLVALSMAFTDERLATSLFGWLPHAITDMAVVADTGPAISTAAAVALVVAFVLFNGIVGPIAEELYFRGHLLARIDRLGWAAPLLGTVMFAIYHFHTPWRYPAILLGFLPIAWLAWHKRSFRVSLAAHLLVNNIFILMMLAAFLNGEA